MKGCKKCCISSAMDGTNGMLWNDSKEDGDVRSECEEDGDSDTDWKGRWNLTCVVY
jgi:hypothetical protein